jgi:hypothetical protein
MAQSSFLLGGIPVKVVSTSDEGYEIRDTERVYAVYSHVDGHPHWYCTQCDHRSTKRDPMLGHIEQEHFGVLIALSRRDVHPALAVPYDRFAARTTPLKLAGKHADPTYYESLKLQQFRRFG